MQEIVLDTEFTLKCPIGNNKGDPMWLGNKLVLCGQQFLNTGTLLITPIVDPYDDPYNTLIIGQNVKVDLLYIYRHSHLKERPLPNIWDIQLAEYILTNQRSKYASLDEMIVKYIGAEHKKDTAIQEYWDNGYDTDEIPLSELQPYLENDVRTTGVIYQQQVALARKWGKMSTILARMDALRATIAMRLNGMAINYKHVSTNKKYYSELAQKVKDSIVEVDVASPKQLSLYFFGGKETIKVKELVGKYKNGNDKYLLVEKVITRPGVINPSVLGLTPGASGYYSTDVDTLKKLSINGIKLAETILSYREAAKISDTFYQGIMDNLFPHNYVYPNLSLVATHTGRLACSGPNLQNQTTLGGVKDSYVSRYGEEGVLVEFDYHQLEIVWLAYLSGCKALQYAINHDIDIHTALYKDMYGVLPTPAQRKAFKPRTFQLIYGAGPGAIAEQAGISLREANRFISTFYKLYPGVETYHRKVLLDAATYKEIYYKDGDSKPSYKYVQTMPWGTSYEYDAYDSEYKPTRTFSPTELKNYPIQGGATGDMVPLMVGALYRAMEKVYDVHLIMTVHDSVLFDMKKEGWQMIALNIKGILEDAATYMKEYLDIDFPCKLKVGISYGPSWGTMEELE